MTVTAERWVPIVEVSEAALPNFWSNRKRMGSFSLGWKNCKQFLY
jgi:hypothetical protein